MIEPVNNHILIEPLAHESFVATQKETYQEIGTVVATAKDVRLNSLNPAVGDKVFFDSWLAAKYPNASGDGFYWLVLWSDVRAIERANAQPPQVSE
jgi:co-chaperonin GroES (HSP10)